MVLRLYTFMSSFIHTVTLTPSDLLALDFLLSHAQDAQQWVAGLSALLLPKFGTVYHNLFMTAQPSSLLKFQKAEIGRAHV